MATFTWTKVDLPDNFDSFVVSVESDRRAAEVQGFSYDPDGLLEKGRGPVVLGAGNTYAQNPYGLGPLHVAHDIYKLTGLPVVSVESYGAHGRNTQRLAWSDGWRRAERVREGMRREVALVLSDTLGLFERPLHLEGHSQSAAQIATWPAVSGSDDGLNYATMTLYDPPGMRWYPKGLVLPTVAKVDWQYRQQYKPSEPAHEPAPVAIAEFAVDHPEIAEYVFFDLPGKTLLQKIRNLLKGDFRTDVDPHFTLERIGARDVTKEAIFKGLLGNPDLFVTYISCHEGNSRLMNNLSLQLLFGGILRFGVGDRFEAIVPEGLLHQRADDPAVRAIITKLGIDMPTSQAALHDYLDTLVTPRITSKD